MHLVYNLNAFETHCCLTFMYTACQTKQWAVKSCYVDVYNYLSWYSI